MSFPTLPPNLVLYTKHDYAILQHLLHTGIKPRLLAFCLLAMGPFLGFMHPPASSSSSSSSPLTPFLCFNTLTLLLCAAGTLLSASQLLVAAFLNPNPSRRPDPHDLVLVSISAQRRRLASDVSHAACGVAILVLAAISLAVTYPFAGLAIAGDCEALRRAVLIPSLIGGCALVFTIFFMARYLLEWWGSFRSDPQLWKAMTEDTLVGSLLARCCVRHT